jgi:hypothetical protein
MNSLHKEHRAAVGLALLTAACAAVVAGVTPGSSAVARTLGWAAPAAVQDFQDVPPSSTFYNYVHNLVTQGIAGGYACVPNGATDPCVPPGNLPYYHPDASVTRQQMSKFIDLGRSQPGIVINSTTNSTPFVLTTTQGIGIVAHNESGDAIFGSSAAVGNGVVGFASTDGNGVLGLSASGRGVDGESTSGPGVYGTSSTGYAGLFQGNVHITGTCCGAIAGTYQIDDPVDPANQYLNQAAVAAPEWKNVYDGNVTTDAAGMATVQLPPYVQALNTDFRYQLTVIGQFAQAIVARKIADNRFIIQTDKPNVEVSWQVTGLRNDPWARDHATPAEAPKAAGDRGKYVYPQGYDQPASAGIGYAPPASRK